MMKSDILHYLAQTGRKPMVVIACSACLITAVITGIRYLGLLEALELRAYDHLMQLRPSSPLQPAPVILIGIDEADIRRFGHPISDQRMTELLKIMVSHQPSAIGVDIFRDQASVGHQALAKWVTTHPQIVLADKILEQSVAGPDFLIGREQLGFIDLKQDRDARIRRGLLIIWPESVRQGEDEYALSLAAQLALRYLFTQGLGMRADPHNIDQIRLGDTVLTRFSANDGGYQAADEGGYQFIMDYRRAPDIFPHFSLTQALAGEIDAELIRGKVVMIGTTAGSVQDWHETPFSRAVEHGPMYGLNIHAHQVDQLIRTALAGDQPIAHINDWQETLLIWGWGVLGAFSGFRVTTSWIAVVARLSSAILPLLFGYCVFMLGGWMPVMAMLLTDVTAFIMSAMWVSMIVRRERQQIMQLFGQFVAEPVAANLWAHRDEFIDSGRLRPQQLTATIMMTDLRGYTTVSEAMQPIDVLEWVNSYMSVMTGIINMHQGIVEDYAGDGIKSSFGVPIPRTTEQQFSEDSMRAVDCALQMGQAFSQLSRQWQDAKAHSNYLRIGISHGQVIAGSIGNQQRMTYTTVGDVVNTAARLECFQKDGVDVCVGEPFRILIDEATYHRLGNQYQADCLGEQYFRGKQQAVKVYRVVGRVK